MKAFALLCMLVVVYQGNALPFEDYVFGVPETYERYIDFPKGEEPRRPEIDREILKHRPEFYDREILPEYAGFGELADFEHPLKREYLDHKLIPGLIVEPFYDPAVAHYYRDWSGDVRLIGDRRPEIKIPKFDRDPIVPYYPIVEPYVRRHV